MFAPLYRLFSVFVSLCTNIYVTNLSGMVGATALRSNHDIASRIEVRAPGNKSIEFVQYTNKQIF